MNISVVSKATGLPVKTVRYYSDIGLVSAPSRTKSGYRAYDDGALRKLVFIRRAREFGFSIDECRELLSFYEDQHRSSHRRPGQPAHRQSNAGIVTLIEGGGKGLE